MDINKRTSFKFSMGSFNWFTGVIEDRNDPKKLGRLRVRLFGYHTENKTDIPSSELFWMNVMMPSNSSSMNGIGSSPTGIVEGSWIVGFFRDGQYCQDGIIMGTIGGIPSTSSNPSEGFNDPTGTYPKTDFLNEPDTNRLSRNEKISETIVQNKKDDRDLEVNIALKESETYDEPDVPDARRYPYNHVKETESGHIEEYDDTEGEERFHRYHRTGTFVEVDKEGTENRHIVKDKYELIIGDDYLHVKGKVNITIEEDANILVKGDCNMETQGNHNQLVEGDYNLQVEGEYHLQSKKYIFINSPLNTRSFDVNSTSAPLLDLKES